MAFRKKLSREKVLTFLAEQPRCVVAMEACGSAHHWVIRDLGHESGRSRLPMSNPSSSVKSMNAADAEAIVEAASRPTMRFVVVKTEEQQARAMLFRTRDLLVRQRTQLINALRGHLSEHGVVAAQGPANVKVLEEAVEDHGPASASCAGSGGASWIRSKGAVEKDLRTLESDGSRSGMRRNDTASADHAGRRPHHCLGDRDLCATDGCLQMWALFRRWSAACPGNIRPGANRFSGKSRRWGSAIYVAC